MLTDEQNSVQSLKSESASISAADARSCAAALILSTGELSGQPSRPDVVLGRLKVAVALEDIDQRPASSPHDGRSVLPERQEILRRAHTQRMPAEVLHHETIEAGVPRGLLDDVPDRRRAERPRQGLFLVDRAEEPGDVRGAPGEPVVDERSGPRRGEGDPALAKGIGLAVANENPPGPIRPPGEISFRRATSSASRLPSRYPWPVPSGRPSSSCSCGPDTFLEPVPSRKGNCSACMVRFVRIHRWFIFQLLTFSRRPASRRVCVITSEGAGAYVPESTLWH